MPSAQSSDDLIAVGLRRATAWVRWRFLNPTRDWPARSVSTLEFDLDTCALNGIREGAPWSELKILGPADRVDTLAGKTLGPDFAFFALGLISQCYKSTVVDFGVVTEPSSLKVWRHGLQPGTVTLSEGGRTAFEISKRTHERDLIARFGAPVESGLVVGEMVHTFAVANTGLDTYHDPDTGFVHEVTLYRGVSRKP